MSKQNQRKKKANTLIESKKSKKKKANTLTEKEKRKEKRSQHVNQKNNKSQHINRKRKNQRKKVNTLEVKSNVSSIFRSSFHELSPLSFLSIFGRKLFGGPEEKTFRPHHLFSFLFTQPNTLQKSFPSYYLSKVFHPHYFTFKQTHPKCLSFISSPHVVASLNNFN